jgi:hypothetical protein
MQMPMPTSSQASGKRSATKIIEAMPGYPRRSPQHDHLRPVESCCDICQAMSSIATMAATVSCLLRFPAALELWLGDRIS